MDHSTQSTEFMAKWFFENFNFFFKKSLTPSFFYVISFRIVATFNNHGWFPQTRIYATKKCLQTIYWFYVQIVFEKNKVLKDFSSLILSFGFVISPHPHGGPNQQPGITIKTIPYFTGQLVFEKKIAKRYFSIYSCFVPSFGAITNSSSKG